MKYSRNIFDPPFFERWIGTPKVNEGQKFIHVIQYNTIQYFISSNTFTTNGYGMTTT